jgi:hypothetical protein
LQTITKTSRAGAKMFSHCSLVGLEPARNWDVLSPAYCVRNAMTKTMTAVATAAIIAAAAIAPTDAEARRGWWIPGAVVGGLAAGAIIAGAAGAYGPYGYYGPGPAYAYGPGPYGPGCYFQRQRVWDGYGWVVRRVRVCY